VSSRFGQQKLAMPMMANISQTKYDGNQSDHHAPEKYAADALLKKNNATRFKATVIASPNNPMNLNELADLSDLHVFIILSAR
jgi:hypothetical protein